MTNQEAPVEGTYFEVDIEYTTQAKMVLLGKDEEDIRAVLNSDFNDIPDLRVISIGPADPELVTEAKARRAFEDAMNQKAKEQLN